MSVLSSITDTVTLLLNTPIVPPRTESTAAAVPLTELPQASPRKRLRRPSVGITPLETADVFVLGRTSMGSTTTSMQSSRDSSEHATSEESPSSIPRVRTHSIPLKESSCAEDKASAV